MREQLRGLKDAAGDIESRLDGGETGSGSGPGGSANDGQAGLDAFAGSAGDGVEDDAGTDQDEDTGTGDGGDPGGGMADDGSTDDGPADDGPADDGATGGGPTDRGAVVSGPTDDEPADEGVVPEAGTDSGAVEVVVDQRELDANVARDLSTREGIETRLETLEVGDYVLSDRVVVERKTVTDFLDTLTGGDRSVFEQVGDAARHYARPVVVLEGGDLFGRRNVHPKAIHGALGSLAVDFGASVMQTAGEDETVDLLATLAEREQDGNDRAVSVHGEKQSRTLPEQQEYVVASVAEVGPVTARSLLETLGSVEAVMTADDERLREAEGVGEVTASRIREVVGSEYRG
jgi:Fanconi anemia group M protein